MTKVWSSRSSWFCKICGAQYCSAQMNSLLDSIMMMNRNIFNRYGVWDRWAVKARAFSFFWSTQASWQRHREYCWRNQLRVNVYELRSPAYFRILLVKWGKHQKINKIVKKLVVMEIRCNGFLIVKQSCQMCSRHPEVMYRWPIDTCSVSLNEEQHSSIASACKAQDQSQKNTKLQYWMISTLTCVECSNRVHIESTIKFIIRSGFSTLRKSVRTLFAFDARAFVGGLLYFEVTIERHPCEIIDSNIELPQWKHAAHFRHQTFHSKWRPNAR